VNDLAKSLRPNALEIVKPFGGNREVPVVIRCHSSIWKLIAPLYVKSALPELIFAFDLNLHVLIPDSQNRAKPISRICDCQTEPL
jgi:hypothetical protein